MQSCIWQVEGSAGATRVTFRGAIDENADFGNLASKLTGRVVLDLGQVRRINSCGVREWVNFITSLKGLQELKLINCSTAVVFNLNTICNFQGEGEVESFFGPYRCPSCGAEESCLLDAGAVRDGSAPAFPCACGAEMELDEIPERYLAFLREG